MCIAAGQLQVLLPAVAQERLQGFLHETEALLHVLEHMEKNIELPYWYPPQLLAQVKRILHHNSVSMIYSKTSEERMLWGRPFCPLFGGCPLSEAPTFNDQYSCSKVFTIQHIIVRTDTCF